MNKNYEFIKCPYCENRNHKKTSMENAKTANKDNQYLCAFCQGSWNEHQDMIHHPSHYKAGKWEVWDIIEGMGMTDYCEANILKYLFRYKHKNGLEDLQKARQYLDRLIKKEEDRLDKIIDDMGDPDFSTRE